MVNRLKDSGKGGVFVSMFRVKVIGRIDLTGFFSMTGYGPFGAVSCIYALNLV